MLEISPPPSGDEKEVRAQVKKVVDALVRPTAIDDDRKCEFRREAFTALAKDKLHALSVPVQYGGRGLSSRCYYASLEEIARGSASLSVSVAVTNLVQGGLVAFGTEEQKKTFLPKLTSGEWIGAFSLSESQSGSDAAGLKLSAKKTDGGFLLNGTKMWCSNAGHADLYLVMTRTGEHRSKGITSFLVPATSKGLRVGKMEKKLGLRASTLAELVFEDCFVPEANRLAGEGEGFTVALSQLDSGRIAIGCVGVALAIEALERLWKHWLKIPREQITDFEGSSQRSADYYTSIQATRSLITVASDLRDQKQPITALASHIKLLGSDTAVQAASEAIVLAGPVGGTVEFEVERLLRDAKSLQIVEGTNQIQRLVLARLLETMMGKDHAV